MNKQPESTGDKGVQLICQFEGLKLERYRDAVGLWTIGYGHLCDPMHPPITEAEAEVYLAYGRDVQAEEILLEAMRR
mgnify:CR=1 FL=1